MFSALHCAFFAKYTPDVRFQQLGIEIRLAFLRQGENTPDHAHPNYLRRAGGRKTNICEFFLRPSKEVQDHPILHHTLMHTLQEVLQEVVAKVSSFILFEIAMP